MTEREDVRLEKQIQFYRECTHRDSQTLAFIHPDDHLDVFMNTFNMDHDIDLRSNPFLRL